MKKLTIFLLIIFSFSLFLINTSKVFSMCYAPGPDGFTGTTPEIDCEGICYGSGKVGLNCNPRWNCPESCRCYGRACSFSCGAGCEGNGDCPGGQCDTSSCSCCSGWNQNDNTNGGYPCCPGVVGWMGKCCTWGQDVDTFGGTCHWPCGDGQVWSESQGSCITACDCTPGDWISTGSGCGNCGTSYRQCPGSCHLADSGTYDCRNQGQCSPGQVWNGGGCGAGGCGTWKNTCQSNCQWLSNDYCSGGSSNAGQACGGCGRGHYDCAGNCIGDYSNCGGAGWSNVGGCGNCGTNQRYCNGCDWTNSYQCVGQGPCSPGQVSWGGGCGSCGTLKQDCGSNCQWGGAYCYGDKTLGPCGLCGRGRTNCAGGCDGDYSNCGSPGWKDTPEACGECGHYQQYCDGCNFGGKQCVGNGGSQTQGCGNCGSQSRTCQSNGYYSGWSTCSGQGPCSPGSTSPCQYGGYQTCTSSCQWPNTCPGCSPGAGTPCSCNSCGQCGGTIQCDGTCSSNIIPSLPTPCGCSTPPGYGSQCNPNACGQYGGTIQCNGQCSGGTPALPSGYGSQCNPNACGQYGGTIQCNGQCSGGTPALPSGYGSQCNCNACGQCGGTIQCNGQCSGGTPSCNPCYPQSTPSNYGSQCNPNACGQYGGTIQCNGQCSGGTPALPSGYGSQCNPNACGQYGGVIGCNGCSGPTPPNPSGYGQSCDSFGGITQCDGSCKGPCAPSPTPSNYGQSCGSCGGSINCAGACSVSTPANYGQSCGNCGKIDCTGSCGNQGACTAGQTRCNGNKYQVCPSCAWQNSGTNADGDAQDKECGDSLCDNTAGVYDITKAATETSCTDTLDNDCNGLTDCADPACFGKANCCTVIKRDCKLLTGQQFREMYKKCYKEEDSAYCSKITSQISGTNFYSCEKNDVDTSCCQNPSSCVFNGVCYPDGTKMDINGDGIIDRCVAHSPGQWIPDFETDCTNGIDDDLDGLIDCTDPDCNGNLNGKTVNQDGQLISFVDVTAKKDLIPVKSVQTAQDGTYSMNIGCGDYNIMTSHSTYAPQTKLVYVPPRGDLSLNFTLVKGTSCESDCTYASDNLVHASCDGKNGCIFYDTTAKTVCDLSQPGWVRDYDSSKYIVCPAGSPQLKIEIQASLSCASGTIIKATRIVVYNGKPVKLVVAACK